VSPFEVSCGGAIIQTRYDLSVKDEAKGFIHPTIVDISTAKYEPMYSPVSYICETVAYSLDLLGTNTGILVLAPTTGKRWIYDAGKFSRLVRASIEEIIECMKADLYPARFGWWCATCNYKGVCHRIL